MHKIIYVALIGLLVAGCSDEPEYQTVREMRTICDDETIEARAQFTLQCIHNANPKSDEEPEDWIHKCKKMAEGTYCKKKTVEVERMNPGNGGVYWRDIKVTVVGN